MNKIDIEATIARRRRWLRAFTTIATIEAITWTGLLVGMYLKYIPETTELGVRIFGSLHGAAFICYILTTAVIARQQEWRFRWITLIALASSVPPWGSLGFDLWARKHGVLDPNGERTGD